MSKQLYEEALADVKKLKEVAEDNAKKALIEAVSPRIKDLIEAELLREADETEDDLLLDDEPTSSNDSSVRDDLDSDVVSAMSLPDDEGKVTLDLDSLIVKPSGEEFELSNESFALINPLIDKLNSSVILRIESKLFQLSEATQKFLEASNSLKRTNAYQIQVLEMVSEVEKTYEYLQESAKNLQDKGVYEGKLEQLYKQLNKLAEQYNMKKNLKSLTEAEITLKLTNVPDELENELGDLGVDLVADAEEGGEAEEEEDLDLGDDEEGSEDSGEEDSEEEDLDLGDNEEEKAEEAQKMESRRLSDNLVVEIDENMLRREIARMRSLREETEPQSWGDGPGEVSDEFEDEDLGEPIEFDLSEGDDKQDEADMEEIMQAYEADKQDEADMEEIMQAYEADKQDEVDQQDEDHQQKEAQQKQKQAQQKKQGHNQQKEAQQKQKQAQQKKQGKQDDLDEGGLGDDTDSEGEVGGGMGKPRGNESQQVKEARYKLSREARIQTEAKKKAQAAKKQQKEAQKKAQNKQQEAQQKMKQKKQQEAQKAKQEAQKQAKQAKKMQEVYAYYANIFNESVRRTAKLQSVLVESRRMASRNGAMTRSTEETLTLRKKLAETNLFNTKLLFCNKLLQNESLTKRQKAEIIERLDEATSEREVKLVYETLVKTLGTPSRQMTEGRRVMGSSSQATRPASTVLSEGYETDRWAKLAGLK